MGKYWIKGEDEGSQIPVEAVTSILNDSQPTL